MPWNCKQPQETLRNAKNVLRDIEETQGTLNDGRTRPKKPFLEMPSAMLIGYLKTALMQMKG